MSLPVELIWASGLLLVPLTALVAIAARWLPLRPSSRHLLWVTLLGLLLLLPFLPRLTPDAVEDLQETLVATAEKLTPTPSRSTPVLAPATTRRPEGSHATPRPRPVWTEPRPDDVRPAITIPRIAPDRTANEPREERAGPPATPIAAPQRATRSAEAVTGVEPPLAPVAVARSSVGVPGSWRRWVSRLDEVRVALAAVPPMPAGLWLFGALAVGAFALISTLRVRRVVALGRPAPFDVAALVLEEAAHLGLRRAPETLMVNQRVSPMIWCGRSPRLILPVELWSGLDDAARRAVVLHELAHLRRADHWVCRLQILVAALYWWHPVMWWIRRRLAEEADHCCDAWVTALRPRARRAYAQALLDTRKYVDRPAGLTGLEPAVGLGVTGRRTRRFARRLTMVMTERKTPRISVRGLMLAGLLVGAGCLAAPVLACPPSKDSAVKAPKPPKIVRPLRIQVRPAMPAPLAPLCPPAPAAPEADDETSYERYLRQRAAPASYGDEEMEDRMRQLEEKTRHLYEKLQQMLEEHGAKLQEIEWPEELEHALEAIEHGDLQDARVLYEHAMQAMHGDEGHAEQERIVRKYELPEGKLDALTSMMVRDDIPILVRPLDDGIEVHASATEHQIFSAFCSMIDGEESVQRYELPGGKLEAMTELMVRSDVPILVEPGGDGIKVHGTDLEQAVFAAFCDMIHPGSGEHAAVARELDELAEHYEKQAGENEGREREMHAVMQRLRQQQEMMMHQAEMLRQRAEGLERRAEGLEEEAEALEEAAETLQGGSRERIMQEARALAEQAARLEAQAERLEAESDSLEEQAESIGDEADKLEDQRGVR